MLGTRPFSIHFACSEPSPQWPGILDGYAAALTWRGHAVFGLAAILVGLALVPALWECGKGPSGWNVLVFILVAIGASQVGAGVGRLTEQRIVGIGATVIAVLGALLLINAVAEGRC
jgi:hypothetical protein